MYSATKAAVAVLSGTLRVEAREDQGDGGTPDRCSRTNLASGIVNFDAFVGITGQNTDCRRTSASGSTGRCHPPQDIDDVAYWTLSPEDLAGQIAR